MSKGFFVSLQIGKEEARELHDRLAKRAAKLGYFTTRGPKAGRGHLGLLLQDLAQGKLAIVRLSPSERKTAVRQLRRLSFRDETGVLRKLADELDRN